MLTVLSKLALRNAKKSSKDYLIYLITVSLAFSCIFAFNLISYSKDVLNLSKIMENFKYIMYFANIFVIGVICFLINYTIKFIFTKRSREFATYILLGIKKKQISKIFILENIILGLFSLLLSIFIGYILSLFMSSIIMNIFKLPNLVKIDLSIKAIFLLVLYFIIIYTITLLLAKKRFKKATIYSLLYLEKQNEKNIIKNKTIQNFLFLLSILLGIIALQMFDLEFTKIYQEPSLLKIFISIILLIISIYIVTITLINFTINLLLKSRKIKYSKDNLFIIKSFSSKIKTMGFTIGTLTTLVTFTLVSLNLSSLCKGMFDYQLDLFAPYDISITSAKDKLPKYEKFIKKKYKIKQKINYDSYNAKINNVTHLLKKNPNLTYLENDPIIKLSDYNKLLKLRGLKEVSLKEDEYILHSTKEYREVLKDNPNLKEIKLTNKIKLKQKFYETKDYSYAWDGGGYIIVIPDSKVKLLEIKNSHLIIDTKEETNEKLGKSLRQIEKDICQVNEQGLNICYSSATINVRGETKSQNNSFITIIAFVCFYIAFIFTTVVGTILATQSLNDSTKNKKNYQILNKLGVNNNQLKKIILKQLALLFLTPIIYPIIISIKTLNSMNKLFKIALMTDTVYLNYFILNFLIFLIIYLIYFTATYFNFKKNIEE